MKMLNWLFVVAAFAITPLTQAGPDSDRAEVVELISQYTWGVDTLDKAVFKKVFTPTATVHYIGVGKNAIDLDERLVGVDALHAWLVKSLGHRKGYDGLPWHFVSNQIVTLSGDTATMTAYMHNRVLAAGGIYYVDAVRTSEGWRIAKLKLEEQTWNADYYNKNSPDSEKSGR